MKPYRSKEMRDFAKDAPVCFSCHFANFGTVVGCHSNSISNGKGMGIKSSDLLAFMCKDCHDYIDAHWKESKVQETFYRAVYESTVWLLQTGRLVTGKPPYTEI